MLSFAAPNKYYPNHSPPLAGGQGFLFLPPLRCVTLAYLLSFIGLFRAQACQQLAYGASPSFHQPNSPWLSASLPEPLFRLSTIPAPIPAGGADVAPQSPSPAVSPSSSPPPSLLPSPIPLPSPSPSPAPSQNGGGLPLTWSEEFDGAALDTNVWRFDLGDGSAKVCTALGLLQACS